jgi:hypothetical protein
MRANVGLRGLEDSLRRFAIGSAILSSGHAVAEGWIVLRGRSIVFCDTEVRAAGQERSPPPASVRYKVSS